MHIAVSSSAPPSDPTSTKWALGVQAAFAAVIVLGLIGATFSDGIRELLRLWGAKEEYSHAYLIPLISGFLAWQKKNELAALKWEGSWLGWALCAFGIALFFAGSLSAIYAVIQYALLITFAGAVIATTGLPSVRYLWPALVYLLFMIPLPQFLYQVLSTKLQLLSSEIEVLIALSGGPAAMLTAWLFVREWHRAIAQAQVAEPQLVAAA